MNGDNFRLFWTITILYFVGSAAPAVAAGGTWSKALALTITSGLIGVLLFAGMFAIIALLHGVWTAGRTRWASYRNA